LASFLVVEIVNFLYDGVPEKLNNQLISLDTLSRKTTEHKVVKRPQCSVCGNVNLTQKFPKPIQLQNRTKENDVEGGTVL